MAWAELGSVPDTTMIDHQQVGLGAVEYSFLLVKLEAYLDPMSGIIGRFDIVANCR